MVLLPEWRTRSLTLTALALERVLPEESQQALRALRDYLLKITGSHLQTWDEPSSMKKERTHQECRWLNN